MNRRGFFKSIGAVSAATLVAPHILLKETPVIKPRVGLDGIVPQMRNGNVTMYGQLTIDHIKEAVEYVFKEQSSVQDRNIKFKCGRKAMLDMEKIFKKEVEKSIFYG